MKNYWFNAILSFVFLWVFFEAKAEGIVPLMQLSLGASIGFMFGAILSYLDE